jgi:hypothetical protein
VTTIDWIAVLNDLKVLKPSNNAGEYILKQMVQMSVEGRPGGLILHAGSHLHLVAGNSVLSIHSVKQNANALLPLSTITYVAVPDPHQNPDDPKGEDIVK